jgi:hypothetical protein
MTNARQQSNTKDRPRLGLSGWSELANIFSALTVVISLVFVGLQVKENSHALRSQNQRALVDSIEQLELTRVTDADYAALVQRSNDGEPLNALEQGRLETMAYLYINNWEQAFYDRNKGLMEEEVFASLDDWMVTLSQQPFFHIAVEKVVIGNSYSDSFVLHLKDRVLTHSSPDAHRSGGGN